MAAMKTMSGKNALKTSTNKRSCCTCYKKAYYGNERVPELAKYTLSEIHEKMYSAEQSVEMLQRVIDGKQHLYMYRRAWENLKDKEIK